MQNKEYINRALDASINIGLAALLVVSCLWILRPFVPLIVWGIIVAVASYPRFQKLQASLGGRGTLAAVLWTLLLLAVLIVPIAWFSIAMIDGIRPLAERLRGGDFAIPPPPANIATWPVIGAALARAWSAVSTDLTAVMMKFSPEIKAALPKILSASAGVGFTVLEFLLSIVVSGALLGNAPAAAKLTRGFFVRLFDDKGPEYQDLVGTTIRSVTFGIIGVALIQAACAAVGFVIVGLPGAGGWSFIFLFAAVVQVGILVLIPAVIYVFATMTATKAVLFLVWCAIVGLMDNVLKPILLGRRAAVPIIVVFLGAIGGFVALGLIGLFVGAIVLSVGYKLFIAWIAAGFIQEPPARDTAYAGKAT